MGGWRPQRASLAGEPAQSEEVGLPNLVEERMLIARRSEDPRAVGRPRFGWPAGLQRYLARR